jgi:hypothetical protein
MIDEVRCKQITLGEQDFRRSAVSVGYEWTPATNVPEFSGTSVAFPAQIL